MHAIFFSHSKVLIKKIAEEKADFKFFVRWDLSSQLLQLAGSRLQILLCKATPVRKVRQKKEHLDG